MKPIRLKISAFGPYKNEVSIDFNKLGNNGIFLITGDTGAGKTTIFDSICFALFGEVSGSNRTVDSLRSDFSTPDVRTFVELEFSHKNKNYKVIRCPKYLKQKKSGVGTTPSIAEATLLYDDTVITGFKEVTDRVIEILSINVKQFKQIAMLAQGEFLQLLFADATERSQIFRKIFETSVFYSISDKLKSKTNQAKSVLDDKKIELDIHIKNIKWDDQPNSNLEVFEILEALNQLIQDDKIKEVEYRKERDEYQNRLNSVKKDIDTSEYINKSIGDLELSKAMYEKMLEQKERNEEDIITIKNNRLALEKINPIKNDIQKTKLEIISEQKNIENISNTMKTELKQLSILKVEYDCLDQKENILKEYNSKISQMNDKLPFYDSIQELNTKIMDIEKDIENIVTQHIDITYANNVLEILIEEKTKLLNESGNTDSSIKLLTKEQNELSGQIEFSDQIISDITDVKQLENECNKKKENFLIKQKEYDIIQKSHNELEMNFLRNQAGVFASKLILGYPCLVCGSTQHPNPAKINGKIITKEELDIVTEKKERLHKELLDYTSELKILDVTVKLKKEKINKDAQLKDDIDVIESKIYELLTSLKEKLNAIFKEILLKKEFLESLNNVDKELKESINNLEENKKKIKQYDALTISMRSELDTKKGEVLNLNKNLSIEYPTKNDLEKSIHTLVEKSRLLQQDINDIKNNYNELNNNFEKNKVLLKKTEEIISKSNMQYEKLQSQYMEAYKQIGFASEEDYLNALISREDLSDLEEKVNNYQTQFKIVQETKSRLLIETKDKVKINTVDLINKKNEIDDKIEGLELIFKELNLRLQNNVDNYTKIKGLYTKIKDMIDNYLVYKDLSDTANGTISGKQKVVFEQFVQASYFNIVIEASNRRLISMTDNRYLLARKESSDKISDKLGLELEIIDNYTGKRRSIKSLSGGESFKAALSLALGLSDTIQNYAGGVVIDNMFIDEGFGSLDSESLEKALDTLNSLTEGNRLIGIISHVAELKERIYKKIIIYKTNNGSNIKLET